MLVDSLDMKARRHYRREKIRSKYHKLVKKSRHKIANPLHAIELKKTHNSAYYVDASPDTESALDPALILLAKKLSSCNLAQSRSSSIQSLQVYDSPLFVSATLGGHKIESENDKIYMESPLSTILSNNSLQVTPKLLSVQAKTIHPVATMDEPLLPKSTSIAIDDPSFVSNTFQTLLNQFSGKREVFCEALRDHTSVCLRIIEFSIKPLWCIAQYIIPLMKYSMNDNTPNGIQCFDEMCALICKVSDLIDKDKDVTSILDTTILEILLDVNRQISVQSQIAFETILHILDDSESLFDILESVTKTRLTEDYYNPELIPFRCMRAEYIKLLFSSALNSSFSEYFRLEKACGSELWNSLKDEPSTVVRNRYQEIFRDFSETLCIQELGEIKQDSVDAAVKRKWVFAKGHIKNILGTLERWSA